MTSEHKAGKSVIGLTFDKYILIVKKQFKGMRFAEKIKVGETVIRKPIADILQLRKKKVLYVQVKASARAFYSLMQIKSQVLFFISLAKKFPGSKAKALSKYSLYLSISPFALCA